MGADDDLPTLPFRSAVAWEQWLEDSHAACEGEAPEVFSVSKQGELTVLQPEPAESQRTAVELAVKYCPTHALSIEED